MSENGVFQITRGILSHSAFADEPFTEREAWMWLIGEAAFRPHKRRVGNRIYEIERGQVVHSIRFMADKWQWPKSRVHRFLNMLRRENMVYTEAGTHSGTHIGVINICNYDKYQLRPEFSGTVSETPLGQSRIQSRNINKTSTSVPYGRARGSQDGPRADPEPNNRKFMDKQEGIEAFQTLADLLRDKMVH